MATTQYIGSRYVPILADPVEWSSTKTYEPLTIVTHEGNSYTSRQFVPLGIDISNEQFWAMTGNYNAQVEQYRRETQQAVTQINDWYNDAVAEYADKYGAKPFAFATVANMQNARDLLYVGAICHTNGFYAIGDGGAAWYVISDTGLANGMDVIACGATLRANLIVATEFVTPEMCGAKGDGIANDTYPVTWALQHGRVVASGKYLTDPIIINDVEHIELHGGTFILRSYTAQGSFDNHLRINNAVSVAFDGCTFDGANLVQLSTRIVNEIFIDGATKVSAINCSFVNACGNGFYLQRNVINGVFSNCVFDGNQIHGISSATAYDLSVDNCTFTNNGALSVDIVVYGRKYADVLADGLNPIASITNCLIKNNGRGLSEVGQPYAGGMKVYAHREVHISNCVFVDNGNPDYIGQQLRVGNYNYYDTANVAKANGLVTVEHCVFLNSLRNNRQIHNSEPCDKLVVADCIFVNTATSNQNDLLFTSPTEFKNNSVSSVSTNTTAMFYFGNTQIYNNVFSCDTAASVRVNNDSAVPNSPDQINAVIHDNKFEKIFASGEIYVSMKETKLYNNELSTILIRGTSDAVVGYNKCTIRNESTNTHVTHIFGVTNATRAYFVYGSGTVTEDSLFFNTGTGKFNRRVNNEWVEV